MKKNTKQKNNSTQDKSSKSITTIIRPSDYPNPLGTLKRGSTIDSLEKKKK